MNQEVNNTFEYVDNTTTNITQNIQPSTIPNIINTEEQIKVNNLQEAQDFVRGLPSWDLTPPYEAIRRVNR